MKQKKSKKPKFGSSLSKTRRVHATLISTGVAVLLLTCMLLIMAVRAQSGGSLLTRQEAIEIAYDVFVHASLDHPATVYMTPDLLDIGDEIRPWDGENREYSITGPTWFCWIDDYPWAKFTHTTRYVFISADTGDSRVVLEPWWPMLNDQPLFMSDRERSDPNIIIYSDVNNEVMEGGE